MFFHAKLMRLYNFVIEHVVASPIDFKIRSLIPKFNSRERDDVSQRVAHSRFSTLSYLIHDCSPVI